MTSTEEIRKQVWRFGGGSDDEGLRLILAFFNITEAGHREEVVELAERLAAISKPLPMEALKLPQDNRPIGRRPGS